MKKIKLFALTALLALGTNAFAAAGDMVKLDNLVYKVNADNKTVTFYGLTKSPTEGVGNTTTEISVPATITTKDAEGNEVSYKVTASMNQWFNAKDVDSDGTDDTQSVVNTIEKMTFAKGIKLAQLNITQMFAANLTALKELTIGQANIVATIPAIKDHFTNLEKLDLSGITNDGDPITIADHFAEGLANLATVKLPSKADVTIGEFAFWMCGKLASVTLSGESNVIGASAFRGCSALTSIDLSKVTSIGEYAFSAAGLTTLTIPENVEKIDANAFYNNEALTTVNITSNKLTSVGAWFGVAEGKKSIIEDVTVNSSSITTIASGAFVSKKLKNITLTGSKLKTITGAFPSTNENLLNVDYSNTIVEAMFNFGASGSLVKYLFPSTIKGELSSFDGYANLTTLSAIPAGVTTFPNNAFKGCKKLAAIDLSGATGLATIGTYAFSDCQALKSIDFTATKVVTIPAQAFYMPTVDDAKKQTYKTALTSVKLLDITDLKGEDGKDLYPNLTISEDAFWGCSSLTTIENLNQAKLKFDGKTQFCYSALNGEIDLSKAIQNDGKGNYDFNNIPQSAFAGCKAITAIILPEGVNTINKQAFLNCEKLGAVTYGNIENLTKIDEKAFEGCALTEVDLIGATNEIFTTIATNAFAYNKSLKTVKLPAQISTIAAGAFCDDIALESINLNQTNIKVLNNIFTSYTGTAPYDEEISLDKLTALKLVKDASIKVDDKALDELTTIADYALQFTGIKEIVIPESVTSLGKGAFRACVDLEKFTWKNVNKAVTTLPDNTFQGDINLKEVYFLTTKTSDVIKDKEVFFMCDKDQLKVYLTPDSYNKTVAEGYGNDNRQYSTLDIEGNKVFEFTASNLSKSDNYYYATYYNMANSSWFDANEFDVFSAVVEGNKVVLKKATADAGYYKIPRFQSGTNDKKALCIVRSKNIDAKPELNSNAGSDAVSTLPSENDLTYVSAADGVKASKLKYQYKLGRKDGVVAFYHITSGSFKQGTLYIEATASARLMNIYVEGEGEVTGIENLFGEEAAAEDNAPVYNLQGARVNGAQKGIYIKNGKKFIVK